MKRVILTRQAKDTQLLAKQLGDQGIETLQFALMAIESLPVDVLGVASDDVVGTVLIFTSVNAVHHGLDTVREFACHPGCPVIAVGARTSQALAEQSIEAISPSRADSEGILELSALDPAMVERVILVKGEGGRDLLQNTLASRGITVVESICYRRFWPAVDVEVLNHFMEDATETVFQIASGEAVVRLTDLVSDSVCRRSLVVVPSARVAQQARALGWTHIIEADGASDEAFIQALNQC